MTLVDLRGNRFYSITSSIADTYSISNNATGQSENVSYQIYLDNILGGDADLRLYRDNNGNRIIDSSDTLLQASTRSGNSPEVIEYIQNQYSSNGRLLVGVSYYNSSPVSSYRLGIRVLEIADPYAQTTASAKFSLQPNTPVNISSNMRSTYSTDPDFGLSDVRNSIGWEFEKSAAGGINVSVSATYSNALMRLSVYHDSNGNYIFDSNDALIGQRNNVKSGNITITNGSITQQNQVFFVWLDNVVDDGYNVNLSVSYSSTSPTPGSANDLNQDGKPDILVHNPNRSWSGAWLMNGTNYSGWAGLPDWSGWRPVGMGDFNSDGKTDVLINNPNNRWNGIWFMNGTTYSGSSGVAAGGWNVSGSGDFNKDNKTDILVHNPTNSWNGVWLMNNTNISGWIGLPAWSGWKAVATGDFNKDGNLDVLATNPSQGWNGIWYTNGSTYTGYQALYSWGSAWQVAGAGDFNQDGNTDILMTNPSQGWNGIALMNGTNQSGWRGFDPDPSGWQIAG